jgi:2'-5' RNA ligase
MRLFTALELPRAVKDAAGQVQAGLKSSGADVKWVGPQGMHLTLKFLGEVDETLLPGVTRALETACRGRAALELELRGCGAFPGRGRPQVVWLGLGGQVEELAALAGAVDAAMAALGFDPERRPFRAHLTLGRVRRRGKGRKPPSSAPLSRALAGVADYRGPSFRAQRAALIKSTLTPRGAVYDPLRVIELGREIL